MSGNGKKSGKNEFSKWKTITEPETLNSISRLPVCLKNLRFYRMHVQRIANAL